MTKNTMPNVANQTKSTVNDDSAALLIEALPYIRRFSGKVVVVKYGGNALAGSTEDDALALFAQDLVLMHLVGLRPIVVHGGGPQITELLDKLGMRTEFHDGLRVTDAEAMEVVRMVLVGQVNPNIVGEINVHGQFAVGVSGQDAGLIEARPRDEKLGFVGDVVRIRPNVVQRLLDDGFIPVVATIGVDSTGQVYNINADTVASAIASTMGAEKLIYLTDVEGLRADRNDASSLISRIDVADLESMIDSGAIADGMIPKIMGCIAAVKQGVSAAHVLDGRRPHVLLLELFTDAGIGTMVEDVTS